LHRGQRDRGLVWCKNDGTVDSRSYHFASWLASMGYDDWSVRLIGPTEASMLLEGYLYDIASNPKARLQSQTSTLQGSTLLLYLKAVSLWLCCELQVEVPVVCPITQKIVQPFRNTITQAFKWGMPQPKRKLYTHQMLATFFWQARTLVQTDPQQNLL